MALPTLESFSIWFNVLALVFTGLTVISGGFALYFALRIGAIKDAEAARLRLDLSKQQEKTVNAEKALLELRERTRQRSLTEGQREHLISSLRTVRMGDFEIWSQVGDPESNAFADQLNAVFGDVGWGWQAGILPYTDAPNGLTVRVRSKGSIPEYAARFLQAAGEIGISVAISEDPNDPRLDKDRVYLIVGSKLPP
jgi:hypothetical protein